jgi:peptidoglycan-associated lipoprotein
MRHAKSKIRFIETFVIATFPIALAVGCSATGEKTASIGAAQEDVAIQQETDIRNSDLNTLTYVETESTISAIPSDESTGQETMLESETAESERLSMQTVETMTDDTSETTVQSDSIVETTDTIPVNLQMPEPAKLEKPQIAIFHFAYNQYDVDEQSLDSLKAHAEYLQNNPQVIVHVNGYSDNRGTAKNNFVVSKKRAQRVADILMSYGVSESQLKVNGYG